MQTSTNPKHQPTPHRTFQSKADADLFLSDLLAGHAGRFTHDDVRRAAKLAGKRVEVQVNPHTRKVLRVTVTGA